MSLQRKDVRVPLSRSAYAAAHASAAEHARITYLIGRLERAVRRRLGSATRRCGLTVAQYTALSVLASRGPLSNAQLARRSLVTPQAMNQIVQTMAVKRLVLRAADPLHARIVLMSLTRKGEHLLRRCDAAVRRVEQDMLRSISAPDRARLGVLLRACATALEGRSPARAQLQHSRAAHPARRARVDQPVQSYYFERR